MKRVLTSISMAAVFAFVCYRGNAATNLVSNTAIVTNRVQGIVTYTMSNGVARVQDPSGKLVGTAEERALKVAADGQIDIASAAADAAGTAMEEWREFTATTYVNVCYIDAGFTQDLPALAPNLCGWVAGSFYDREKGEDHYYVWFNREMDYPPSMCARIVSESGTNWLDGAWKDWAVTNWIDKATGREWTRPYSAEVEYLESSGEQYIDPNFEFVLPVITRSRVRFLKGNTTGCGVISIYGGFANGNKNIYLFSNRNSYFGLRFNGGQNVNTGIIANDWPSSRDVEIGIYQGYQFIKVDGDVLATGNITTTYNKIEQSPYIFAIHDLEVGGATFPSSIQLHNLFLSCNDIIVRDFIPVLDLAGRPAMYDRVSGQLFYNQGTGEFAYGPVTAAPVPCRELVVPRRNANCVLKTGTVITLGGKDGFDADIHKVNIEVGGEPTVTTSAQLPLFYAVTHSGTNRVTRAYTNGFVNVENGFIKEPTNE